MTTLNSQERGLVARRVSIDEWLTAIPCLMDPRNRWNGWACPYFTREAVERIIAAIAPDGSDDLVFATDWEAGTVTLTTAIGTRDEYTDVVEAVEIDGTPYWPVGAWGWVWSDDDEDNCPNASDYAPCRVDGCDHDPKRIAAERALSAEGLCYLAPEYDEGQWFPHEARGLDGRTAPVVMRTGQYYDTRQILGGDRAQREAFAEALAAAGMADAMCVMADPDLVPRIDRTDSVTVLTFLARDGGMAEDFPEEAPAYVAVLKMAEAFGVIVED